MLTQISSTNLLAYISNYLYISKVHFINTHKSPSIMKDLVTAGILLAKSKGKLSRIDLISRYLRMKYHLNTSRNVIAKRIMFLEMQKPYSVY